MKLTCSKCDHISDQPINWFTGKYHGYVWAMRCAIAVRSQRDRLRRLHKYSRGRCVSASWKGETSRLIFFTSQRHQKRCGRSERKGRAINVKTDRRGNDE